MNRNIHLVSHFDAGKIHQGSVEDDSLRVSDFGDGLCHRVIRCFTEWQLSIALEGNESGTERMVMSDIECKAAQGSRERARAASEFQPRNPGNGISGKGAGETCISRVDNCFRGLRFPPSVDRGLEPIHSYSERKSKKEELRSGSGE